MLCSCSKKGLSETKNAIQSDQLGQVNEFPIVIESDFSISGVTSIMPVVEDVQSNLRKSSSVFTFPIRQSHALGSGLVLSKNDSQFSDIDVNDMAVTDYAIKVNGQKVHILARTELGLKNGMYAYLEELGFRWYMPGELWTYTPQLTSFIPDQDLAGNAQFLNCFMSATGGSTSNLAGNIFGLKCLPKSKHYEDVVSNKQIGEAWAEFKERNQLYRSFQPAGHWATIQFNKANQKVLKANPEYRALHKGKRVNFTPHAQVEIANPELRSLFVSYQQEQFLKRKNGQVNAKGQTVNNYKFPLVTVSAEPNDGIKHSSSAAALRMGSVSYRVFTLANEVAGGIDQVNTNRNEDWIVPMLAYSAHAESPKDNNGVSLPLHEKIHVSIAAGAFQRYYSYEGAFHDWKKSTSNLGVYEYWDMIDWNGGNHTMSLEKSVQNIEFWKNENLKSAIVESNQSKIVNWPFIMALKELNWKDEFDFNQISDEFSTLLFEEAAGPMRRLVRRWAQSENVQADLKQSTLDIQEAKSLANSELVLDRIAEYEKYVYFLYLKDNYDKAHANAKSNLPAARKAGRDLIQYTWSLYPTMIVQSNRISDVLINLKAKAKVNGKSVKYLREDAEVHSLMNTLGGFKDAYAKPKVKVQCEQNGRLAKNRQQIQKMAEIMATTDFKLPSSNFDPIMPIGRFSASQLRTGQNQRQKSVETITNSLQLDYYDLAAGSELCYQIGTNEFNSLSQSYGAITAIDRNRNRVVNNLVVKDISSKPNCIPLQVANVKLRTTAARKPVQGNKYYPYSLRIPQAEKVVLDQPLSGETMHFYIPCDIGRVYLTLQKGNVRHKVKLSEVSIKKPNGQSANLIPTSNPNEYYFDAQNNCDRNWSITISDSSLLGSNRRIGFHFLNIKNEYSFYSDSVFAYSIEEKLTN